MHTHESQKWLIIGINQKLLNPVIEHTDRYFKSCPMLLWYDESHSWCPFMLSRCPVKMNGKSLMFYDFHYIANYITTHHATHGVKLSFTGLELLLK